MDNIEKETLERMENLETKTHEEILAGWDKLIEEIEDDRYNYFWDKGYDDYMHPQGKYELPSVEKDSTAYRAGWFEAQYKCREERG